MSTPLSEFYSSGSAQQDCIVGEHGDTFFESLRVKNAGLVRGEVPTTLVSKLGETVRSLYESIEQVDVKVDGEPYSFEIGHIKQGSDDDTELRVSSYSSSMTTNPGNVYEVALWAHANPNRSYVYVASPGNGLTSPLADQEAKYYRQTGSMLIRNDTKPQGLPLVRGLHLALKERGIAINRLGSDSAGAILVSAYGAAFGDGAITSVHENVRTNMVDRTRSQLMTGMLWTEAHVNGPFNAKSSPDVLKVSQSGWGDYTREIAATALSKSLEPKKSLAMMRSNLTAFTRGPRHGDPLLKDMTALLTVNNTADVLFTHGENDPLSVDRDLLIRRRNLAHWLSLATRGTVTSAVIEGVGHGPHTFYPQYLHALHRATLGV